jgi:hypothetical protein
MSIFNSEIVIQFNRKSQDLMGNHGKTKFTRWYSIPWGTMGKTKFTGCDLIQQEIMGKPNSLDGKSWEQLDAQDAIQSNRKSKGKPNSQDVI